MCRPTWPRLSPQVRGPRCVAPDAWPQVRGRLLLKAAAGPRCRLRRRGTRASRREHPYSLRPFVRLPRQVTNPEPSRRRFKFVCSERTEAEGKGLPSSIFLRRVSLREGGSPTRPGPGGPPSRSRPPRVEPISTNSGVGEACISPWGNACWWEVHRLRFAGWLRGGAGLWPAARSWAQLRAGFW